MTATATTAIYVALFALFAVVRPWTTTVALDAVLLAAYLALCRRHGLDALRGTQLHRPVAGSLLLVLPVAFVLGSYSISGPWAPGILFLLAWVPLHLGWTVFAIAVGFLFGFLYEWTGNLIAPIAAHTLVNAVNLRLLSVRYQAVAR